MDHSGMDMGASPTTAMDATMTGMSAASTTSAMSMDGMMGGCKISMLWNWYTVNSCFISSTWKVSSEGIFALSCIGVVLLVIALELVRRMQREYDRHIIRHAALNYTNDTIGAGAKKLSEDGAPSPIPVQIPRLNFGFNNASSRFARFLRPFNFRPTLVQQMVRGLLYMVQFGAAYFVMLLAMYYNGYIIICILIGAFLGFTLFGYDNLSPSGSHQETGTSCC
ncbi:hypothetical protein H072_4161 [Dactylellina haptotyla CBS 200.50]|uniref:Copper transport protein n=1 Tax=Dactylellina haptotyla (strain CBS 200.50) TaxID=1284197 RepID=S8BR28_DACHA|nr:hypothetical protein H072_4161 [Dactylellina haptotyla CBS 200.50]